MSFRLPGSDLLLRAVNQPDTTDRQHQCGPVPQAVTFTEYHHGDTDTKEGYKISHLAEIYRACDADQHKKQRERHGRYNTMQND